MGGGDYTSGHVSRILLAWLLIPPAGATREATESMSAATDDASCSPCLAGSRTGEAGTARFAMALKSGGGVLCIAALQILVGICLLGIYEAFKVRSHHGRPVAQACTRTSKFAHAT